MGKFLNENEQRSCIRGCLLYTSDAADEEDSVDLGGRRIIKKKTIKKKKERKHHNEKKNKSKRLK